MSVALAVKYAPKVDELFKAESKLNILTNTDYDWTGAHTIKVYKMSTAEMNDYSRNRNADDETPAATISRFGEIYDLSATTEELMLKNDRSFIFNVDKMDGDETNGSLQAETALARQLREKVVPEIDSYVYGVMAEGAGTIVEAETALSAVDIYEEILKGTEALDDAEVPEQDRVLVLCPAVYKFLKRDAIFDNTDIGVELRQNGAVAYLDGMLVIKVPSSRLPENFGFMIAHPSATVAPVKLEDYGIHHDTPLSSGDIVTGRVVYDAFVLDNKADGIYYYQNAAESGADEGEGAGEGE